MGVLFGWRARRGRPGRSGSEAWRERTVVVSRVVGAAGTVGVVVVIAGGARIVVLAAAAVVVVAADAAAVVVVVVLPLDTAGVVVVALR